MVYVEGAGKFIKYYKRLMVNRIAWTEAARSKGGEEVVLQNDEANEQGVENGEGTSSGKGKGKEGEEAASLEDNKCWLVWEGMLRDRSFNNFRAKSCPTDGAAKELLGEKLKGYWDMAKNWKGEEEEGF